MEGFRYLAKTLFWFDMAFIMVILTFMMIAVFIVVLHDEMEKRSRRYQSDHQYFRGGNTELKIIEKQTARKEQGNDNDRQRND